VSADDDVVWPEHWQFGLESIDVRCPWCGAPPGQLCEWRGGRRTARYLHLRSDEDVAGTVHVPRYDRAARVWRRRKASEAKK
jgi:hypothetical protein